MLFNRGSKAPNGANGKPMTGGVPEGGYGSGGAPSKARANPKKGTKPSGSGKGVAAHKPSGGYGTHGKPSSKASKSKQNMGDYANDGMSWPETFTPKGDKTGRKVLPKGKFTY